MPRTMKFLIFIIFFAGFVFMLSIHSFLAVTKPVPTNLLVVEGWLPDSDLKLAADEFHNGHYKKLITIGGPVSDGSLNDMNIAEQAAQKLISFAVEESVLTAVPFSNQTKHKTFMSFIALRNWIIRSDQSIKSLNLFTGSVHARKSWTICQRVLGDSIKVGVFAAPPQRYHPRYWWLSKRGIRLVFKNTVSYFYALLFPWQRLSASKS